ncbi:MAG TPA: cupin domain-containing protein [Arenibaculum sp.]|nr:cupin domain-containing protein [Arenibaculum sp.]
MPFGIALSQLAPGESSTRHAHAQREGFFIMAGEPELRLDDEALPLGPGDVVVVEPGHRHCLANPPGKPPVDYVCLWWHETPLPPAERA